MAHLYFNMIQHELIHAILSLSYHPYTQQRKRDVI